MSLLAPLSMLLLALPVEAGGVADAPQALPFPLVVDAGGAPSDALGVRLAPVPARVAALAAAGLDRVRLVGVPTPRGGTVELELERVALDTSRLELHVDGVLVPGGVDTAGLSLWRGRVVGVPGSEAFLGFSPSGSRGWFRSAEGLVHLIAAPDESLGWRAPRGRVVAEAGLAPRGLARGLQCEGPLLDAVGGRLPHPPSTAAAPGAPAEALECRIAWETDYQLYERFGDFDALEDYVLMLLGAVAQRYEEQIDVVLTSVYLAFYTDSNDPWTTPDLPGSSGDMLGEFQQAWRFAIPNGAHLGHFLSGADLGGGVAWLDVLCNEEFGFAVSGNITHFGLLPGSPATQGPFTWDFMVIAHELGHNFGTPHTFTYVPPIDECPNVCIGDGTIMSYCHLCSGGMNNITTYFHPIVVDVIRERAEASCLEPFQGPLLGALYCSPAVPNSTGSPGRMVVNGSTVVGDDFLVLTALDLPPESNIGYFLMGQGTNVFTPPGSDGPICVAPGLVRYLPPVSNTNELLGGFRRTVGTAGPVSGGIDPGETWNFQAWHRDQLLGSSNLTDAVSVSFR